jgi:hypothetical protein
MAIAKYSPSCGKNVPGNAPEMYITEVSAIRTITATGNKITGITLSTAGKFKPIKADFDSVQYTSEGTFKTSGGETQNLIFRLSKPTAATEILLNSLKDAAPCGMAVVFVDGNRTAKAFGFSETNKEGLTRPINQVGVAYDSGTLITDEDSQAYTLTLTRLGYYGPVPLSSTFAQGLLAGTATWVAW